MNSDKFDALLSTLPNLQNLDFHLTKVPNDKINRKEEKEMERTFRLRKKNFSFEKKGMILKGEVSDDNQYIFVRAWDIYLNNKDIMSDDEVEFCLSYGINHKWMYLISELESLEPIKLTRLDYEMLKFVQKQGAKYICRDGSGVINLYEKEPRIIENEPTWWAGGENSYLNAFTKQLFQFVTWESQKYYVIEDVLENCEIVED